MEHDPLSLGTAQPSRRYLDSPSSKALGTGLRSRRVLRSSQSLRSRRVLPVLLSSLILLAFTAPNAGAQSIIPARPEAIGGGNPVEGLGRLDDPNPSREAEFSSRFDPYASESSESTEGNEARRESAESKHEFAEGQSEANDAFNEGAESRSDSAADLDSGESAKGRSTNLRTGSLAPTLRSPQPGETIRRGGFSNFSKEQEASINLDLKLRAAEKARQKAAQKRAAGKTDATKSQKSNKDKVDNAVATRRLSQADRAARTNGGRRSPREGLVPPPPPYSVPLISKSDDTPERKALELINQKKYATAESKLQDLISTNSDNCHARYLLGVSLVWQRKYDEASKEYSYVIEHSTDEKLIDLAKQGLQKL